MPGTRRAHPDRMTQDRGSAVHGARRSRQVRLAAGGFDAMSVLADYPFLNIMWSMFVFFAWVIFIYLLILVLADNFRRTDHSGWAKAGWTLFVIFVPLIGVLVYMIARPSVDMSSRRRSGAARSAWAAGYSSVAIDATADVLGVVQVELVEDRVEMALDRTLADPELLGDDGVRVPLRDEREHLGLPRRQPLQAIGLLVAPSRRRRRRGRPGRGGCRLSRHLAGSARAPRRRRSGP